MAPPYFAEQGASDPAMPGAGLDGDRRHLEGIVFRHGIHEADHPTTLGHQHPAPQHSPAQHRRRVGGTEESPDRVGLQQTHIGLPEGGIGHPSQADEIIPGGRADAHAAQATRARRRVPGGLRTLPSVDAPTIAASAAAGLLFLALLVVVGRTRSRTRRLMTRGTAAEREVAASVAAVADAEQRGASARIGEREAGWAAQVAIDRARTIADRADILEGRVAEAERTAALAEAAADELRDGLRRAEADRDDADRARRAAETRVAELETEAAATARALREARAEIAGMHGATAQQGDHAGITEVAALRERIAALEIALAAARNGRGGLAADPWGPDAVDQPAATIARLEQELAECRQAHDAARSRLAAAPDPGVVEAAATARATLAAREAEVRELEQRLAALSAARHAEITRLNERIAAMERLYGEIERRDHRIADLETALADAGEDLDAVRNEVQVLQSDLAATRDRLATAEGESRSATQALASAEQRLHDLEQAAARPSDAEVRQLRELLAGERERNARLARRGATVPDSEAAVSAAVAPLRAEIARLESALRPAPAPPPTDVTLIKGIGPVIARILAGHGITTLQQVATMTEAQIDAIGPTLPVYPDRIRDDRWVEQARRLLGGG